MEKNIWGVDGCFYADGTPCKLCCIYLGNFLVPYPGKRGEQIMKPREVPCPHLKESLQGCCGIYLERLDVCRMYWCGSRSRMERMQMINWGFISELISSEVHLSALSKLG